MGDIQLLMDMGFPKDKAEYALQVTNNAGVEPAMEWLLAHGDESIPTDAIINEGNVVGSSDTKPDQTPDVAASASASKPVPVAKSLKCDECSKLCKDQLEVEYHAASTGHTSFSESTEEKKPLTEEEKKQQLLLIEEKLKKKRAEREERERVDALEREKNRIKSGKDLSEARRRMEDIEMRKIVEQRKREKEEEKVARARVLAQIEADKAARSAREQKLNQEVPTVSSTTTSSTTTLKSPPKEYAQTRIQIRCMDGSTLTEVFNVKEQLSAVRVFIQMKTGMELPFRLMTTFPRNIFKDEDYEKPLDALGLVPSAVLTMTKLG